MKGTVVAARQRVETTRQTLEAQRPTQPVVDVAFCTIERDIQRGGGLMAGALAYRFFFWLLPFCLVLVAGIGFLASADESAPQDLARSFGVVGFAAQSISDAAETSSRSRWWALAVGLPGPLPGERRVREGALARPFADLGRATRRAREEAARRPRDDWRARRRDGLHRPREPHPLGVRRDWACSSPCSSW